MTQRTLKQRGAKRVNRHNKTWEWRDHFYYNDRVRNREEMGIILLVILGLILLIIEKI